MNSIQGDVLKEKYSELVDCVDRDILSQKIFLSEDNESFELFSHLRGNLIEWIPFKQSDCILIVGADRGVYSSTIYKRVKEVLIIDSNKDNCILATRRCSNGGNVRCLCLPLSDIKYEILNMTYDYIIIADPFVVQENSELNKIINVIKNYLKEDGVLIWGAYNQMGIKYWSGCKSRVTDEYFSDIENYRPGQMGGNPSYNDFLSLTKCIPLKYKRMYYPYPDLTYPTSIYSDSFLPGKNDLTKNAFSYEKRIITFNEVAVWNNIIRNELFRQFSNAFLLIMSNDEEKLLKLNIFTKYSNDRAEEYSIRTDIFCKKNMKKYIRKRACTVAARKHVVNMLDWEKRLIEQYSDTELSINKIEYSTKDEIIFEFIEGIPFLQRLETLLAQDNYESFQSEFERFTRPLIEKSKIEFIVTDDFIDVFGFMKFPAGLKSAEIADIDFILSNMMLTSCNGIEIIDYEWVFTFPIPTNFMIYRSIEYFFRGPRGIQNFNPLYMSKLYDFYEIDEIQIEAYKQMENNFQKFVCGNYMPQRNMKHIAPEFSFKKTPRIYYDFGKGFDLYTSYFCDGMMLANGYFTTKIAIPYGVKKVRIDPSEKKCFVSIKKMSWLNDLSGVDFYQTNGFEIGEDKYLFDTNDSQIVIDKVTEEKKCLEIEMTIIELEDDVIKCLIEKCNDDICKVREDKRIDYEK